MSQEELHESMEDLTGINKNYPGNCWAPLAKNLWTFFVEIASFFKTSKHSPD
jgi:hypothetical protein